MSGRDGPRLWGLGRWSVGDQRNRLQPAHGCSIGLFGEGKSEIPDKSIIGDGLRARSPAGQGSEVVLGCEILNRMTALGRPVSYRIGR